MTTKTGAENVRFDLSSMYSGPDDPELDLDLAKLIAMAKLFDYKYRGKLHILLGNALKDMCLIEMLSNKIFVYLFLNQSVNQKDERFLKKMQSAESAVSPVSSEHLTFFSLEIMSLRDETIEVLAANDPFVAKHLPYIEDTRKDLPHTLSEEVESALGKRSITGASSWAKFFDEVEADLVFKFQGKDNNLEEMTHLMSEHEDEDVRAEALKVLNDGLGGYFAKYSAQTLNMIARAKSIERKERGYKHAMSSRNESNKVPDAVVDALHAAVKEVASPLMKRFYKLKAELLGLDKLRWSDRNAKLSWLSPKEGAVIPYDAALEIVLDAYRSFSPTLAGIIEDAVANKRIDAPVTPGRRGGAFNYSIVLPGNKPVSFTFLNYLGSHRDVMTLAHELGHGVHGMLAGEAQGPLMSHAPIAYAETASVFGEMTTFNHLRKLITNDVELLTLLVGKIDDMANTAVRQIGFSNFEQRIHGTDARLSAEDLSKIWLETLKELYGEDGEVFTYENTSNLWAYISHFHRPFYVYGYAFGELLTQSLYAERERLGEKFEPLYLDMLRAGGTKDAVELLKPFGLDPTDPEFWKRGVEVSLGKMIDEAEALARKLKLVK